MSEPAAATGGTETTATPGTPATAGGSPPAAGGSPSGDETSAGGAAAGAEVAMGGSAAAGETSTGGTPDVGTEPPAVACSVSLSERVQVTDVPVSPEVQLRGIGINAENRPVILGTSPNGGAKVAWDDGTNAHVTPLDATGQRLGDDWTVEGVEVRGFVAHDDGAALIVVRGDAMVFVRFDASGNVAATLDIVGNQTHDVDGARWIDDWPHQGRLAWSGSEYSAYFGQTGNHGAAGNHQGDNWAIISPAGERQSGGWDWGCSHSLDSRIAHNGTDWAPICISDTYPGAGIFFRNRVEVSHEPSVTNVGGVAKLGGLVPAPDGYWLSFTTPENRASPDVAFIHIDNEGSASGQAYLTDTADVDERYSHLAAYGDQLLAGWDSGGQLTLAVIDTAGSIVEGPVETATQIGGQDDFATFANGDAGFAAAWDDLGLLRVVRVARCE